jgi:hypothetical protein
MRVRVGVRTSVDDALLDGFGGEVQFIRPKIPK